MNDGLCMHSVLVEAPDGLQTRLCVDHHPDGTDHCIRFRGSDLSVPAGASRLRVTASSSDVDRPVLV